MTTWWSGLQYGAWVARWIQAEGAIFPSQDSLTSLNSQIEQQVLATTQAWMTGEIPDAPQDQSTEMWAVAAELRPLQQAVEGLRSRPMSKPEQMLLEAATWADRPAQRSLIELGQDLREDLTENRTPDWWHPLGWLPSEQRIIASAAGISTIDELYSL